MKTRIIKTVILALINIGIMVPSFAMAAAPHNVANTPHNFQYGGGSNAFTASDSKVVQVCIFCHTPHNAGQNRLLWNKANNSVINFRLYTSSGTLTSVTRASSLPAGSPSLLCLGCHDGKTAMNILHSSSYGINAPGGYPAGSKLIPTSNSGNNPLTMPDPVYDILLETTPASRNIGGGSASTAGDDLTNDHPIGFSYSNAYTAKLSSGGGLHAIGQVATKSSNSIRFFGPQNRVECSSCHDPHIDTSAPADSSQKPFLVMGNSGSALCMSCHDK